MNRGEAVRTDGQTRDVEKGKPAKAAGGRKEDRKKTFEGAFGPRTGYARYFPRSNTRPIYGLTCADSVLTTAEDGLLKIPREIRGIARIRCSIAAPRSLGNVP